MARRVVVPDAEAVVAVAATEEKWRLRGLYEFGLRLASDPPAGPIADLGGSDGFGNPKKTRRQIEAALRAAGLLDAARRHLAYLDRGRAHRLAGFPVDARPR